MGRYITQSRISDYGREIYYKYTSPTTPVFRTGRFLGAQGDGNPVMFGLPSETVTSWRTGKGVRTDNSSESDLLTGSSSGLSARSRQFKNLSKERRMNEKFRYDTGHTFLKTASYAGNFTEVNLTGLDPRYRYVGPLLINRLNSSRYPTIPPVDLNFYGSRAIAATVPNKPHGNLATLLSETIQRRPTVPPTSLADYKSAKGNAGEYLNYQFGITPTVNDTIKLAFAVKDSKRIIEQFKRDSGRVVRRRMSFPPEVTVTNTHYATGNSFVMPSPFSTTLQSSQLWQSLGSCTVSDTTTRRIWFSGAYSYYVPITNSVLGRLKEWESLANQVIGFRASPELLWQLSPWSWLVDWNWSIGTMIGNWTRLHSDGLVIRYAYLMCETVTERVCVMNDVIKKDGTRLGTVVNTTSTVRKERIRASPYGFGLNPSSFSLEQWSILGALGMTRSPSSLRVD